MRTELNSPRLVVFAMKEEAQGLFENEGISVLYTGVGKVNASYRLAIELGRRRALGIKTEVVLNFGTAGSPKFRTHELVEITRFSQRDMDVSALGFQLGHTPYDSIPHIIEAPKRMAALPSGVCGTGDSFSTDSDPTADSKHNSKQSSVGAATGVARPRVQCDVVDMEAFALAKICFSEEIPFLSIKYITDGSDKNAHSDWLENLPRAAVRFLQVYRDLERATF